MPAYGTLLKLSTVLINPSRGLAVDAIPKLISHHFGIVTSQKEQGRDLLHHNRHLHDLP